MTPLDRTVRWNTIVLAAGMALNWATITLLAALTALTTGSLFGLPELAGAAFAVAVLAIAVGSIVVGRLMDRAGRRNALLLAFLVGAAGAGLIYLGVSMTSLPMALVGVATLSFGSGGVSLSRLAGADMYPPQRRPRGIALILFGAAFGAIGAPLVFAPLLPAAHAESAGALAAPWLVAVALMIAGALLMLAIRVDPRAIAEQLRIAGASGHDEAVAPPRPLGELLRVPLVPLALLAAFAGQGVMTTIMALAGLVLHQHGHEPGAVTVTVSVHFVGMFGLVLIVGRLVERIGRFESVVLGLAVLAAGALLMLPAVELAFYVPGMFLVGVGWNIAFVSSTALLGDAARPNERGRLLGFSDFLALCGAATMSLVGGLVLADYGLTALLLAAIALALVPAVLIGFNRRRLGTAQVAS